ncbi:MAG: SurA N-terminal domain-containing protein [Magnetococcales bacterium]|nr:SurA N-terminal domain-containing protein [Magnetococcales bacterium]
MLNVLRKGAETSIAKMLLALVAMSFVAWGAGDFAARRANAPVAIVGDSEISLQQFSKAYDDDFNRLRQQFNGRLDKKTAEMLGLKQNSLNNLINRHLLIQAGRDMRLAVSDDYVRQDIAANPVFKENGRFSSDRYELLLQNNRMTPSQFEGRLAQDLVTNQLQRAITTITQVPEPLFKEAYRLSEEKRTAAILTLKARDLEVEIEPTEEELNTHLTENQNRFMKPTRVKLRYVVLSTDSVREDVPVSQEELEDFYAGHSGEYRREEVRRLSHILVPLEEGSDDEAKQAAREKIQQVADLLKAGGDFSELAKNHSDDISAEDGGSLGEFSRGVMPEAFDKVAFSLAQGVVSEPVLTEFGYHLIRVDGIEAANIKTLEEVEPEIRARIVEDKALDLVFDRSITLEDQLFASGELQSVAEELNLRFRETEFISRNDPTLTSVEKEAKFLETAFATAKGELSQVVEISDNRFIALEVLDREESSPKTLEEARQEVEKSFKKQAAQKLAREKMETLLKALLNREKDWAQAATEHQAIQYRTTEPFSLGGGKKAPTKDVREAIFLLNTEHPDHTEVIESGGTFKLVSLLGIVEADPKGLEAARKKISPDLEKSLGAELFQAFVTGLRQTTPVEINQEVFERF